MLMLLLLLLLMLMLMLMLLYAFEKCIIASHSIFQSLLLRPEFSQEIETSPRPFCSPILSSADAVAWRTRRHASDCVLLSHHDSPDVTDWGSPPCFGGLDLIEVGS